MAETMMIIFVVGIAIVLFLWAVTSALALFGAFLEALDESPVPTLLFVIICILFPPLLIVLYVITCLGVAAAFFSGSNE